MITTDFRGINIFQDNSVLNYHNNQILKFEHLKITMCKDCI